MTGERVTAFGAGSFAALGDIINSSAHVGDVIREAVLLPPPADVVAEGGLWQVPRPATKVFVGRDADYERLAEALSAGGEVVVTQALTGLGGVGKSELALQYAHEQRARSRTVWWVAAEGPEQILSGLADLTRSLVPEAAREASDEEAARWAVGWLAAHPGWLLILDNVNEPTHLEPWLAVLEGGSVLVTSRRDVRWPGTTSTIRLGLLDPDAAIRLLMEVSGHTQPAERDTAAQIAEELGYLPLALDQAAAYIRQKRIPLARYLTALREQPARVYESAANGDKAQATIARLWDITLQALAQDAPDSIPLLQTLACYAPDAIPRALTTPPGTDPFTTDDALGTLASHNIITLTDHTISLHRLTQAVILHTTPTHHQPHHTALTWLLHTTPDDPQNNVNGWPQWRALLPHIHHLTTHYPTTPHPPELGTLLNQTSIFHNTQGQHQQAHTLLTTAITHTTLNDDHPDVATWLGNLAVTYSGLGRASEALPLFERALEITRVVLGDDHPDVATCLGNLAVTYCDLGRAWEALPLEQRALEITRVVLGDDHPRVAIRLENLAGTFSVLGHASKALPLFERALEITRAALGDDHPDVAIRLGNLAVIYCDLGRASEALPLEQRALEITRAALGDDHPTVAIRLGNLAATYRDLGRASEAVAAAVGAHRCALAGLGSGHPTTQALESFVERLKDLYGVPD
ncbi:FxSxx-COOH system tetratricopeptide repeat protein [Actinocorallia sp. API 0066]|uniref:FxSxx-COOH system tetratricopeptide repeat protein n=1 Tax=Actinocorallia sp. API 0066 TaxID=2896846 RepID=UPI001E2F9700|nr:FxSxx-COOH system tetratricopeptide repeat protein [Actinocorallia sp. API 0066]MCD0453129.1 FxSxx-COOH system tetratricopeptide repeat protein [Actinocorallia sp. API 0066]